MRLAPGTRVDRYTVVRRVREDELGTVYEVNSGDEGAAGRLTVGEDSGAARRDPQAVAALLGLRHPNLVPVLAVVDVGGATGVVEEGLDAPSLAEVIEGGESWTPAEVLPFFNQLCRGVSVAHTAGLVHGHLGPQHVVLEVDEGVVPRIGGFGLGGAASVSQDVRSLVTILAALVDGSDAALGAVLDRGRMGGFPTAESFRAAVAMAPRTEIIGFVGGEGTVAPAGPSAPPAAEPVATEVVATVATAEPVATEVVATVTAAPVPAAPLRPPAPPPRGLDATAAVVGVGVFGAIFVAGVLWLAHDEVQRIGAAEAQVVALASALDRPWLAPPAPMAAALHHAHGGLDAEVAVFQLAPTAGERIVAARALVRAVRGELARQTHESPTPEAMIAMGELEPIDDAVVAAERALAAAQALRTEWPAAVALTLGWFDASVPAGHTELPPARPLPVFVSGVGL